MLAVDKRIGITVFFIYENLLIKWILDSFIGIINLFYLEMFVGGILFIVIVFYSWKIHIYTKYRKKKQLLLIQTPNPPNKNQPPIPPPLKNKPNQNNK